MAKKPSVKAESPYVNDLETVGEGDAAREVPAGGSVRLPGLSIDWMKLGGKGATLEAVIEAVKQRIDFLQDHFPSDENIDASVRLGQAIGFLNARTARRKHLGIEGTYKPDVEPHTPRH